MDILDLDALAPEPKTIVLGKKKYKVFHPGIRQSIAMQRLFSEMGTFEYGVDEDAEVKLMQRIEQVILPLVPEMAKDKEFKIDFSFKQLIALLNFINSMDDTGEKQVDNAKKK